MSWQALLAKDHPVWKILNTLQPRLESLQAREHPVRAAMLSVYRCRLCQWFHLGHSAPRRRRGRWVVRHSPSIS